MAEIRDHLHFVPHFDFAHHGATSETGTRLAISKKKSSVSNRKASSIRPFSSASPKGLVRISIGQQVIVERGGVRSVHPDGDGDVGHEASVETDFPAQAAGGGFDMASDDGGGEFAVDRQQIGRRIASRYRRVG